MLHSGRRADLLFSGGKEAGGWQRVPPKSMAARKIIPLGLNENTHCLSDSLQRKFGNLCFGAQKECLDLLTGNEQKRRESWSQQMVLRLCLGEE